MGAAAGAALALRPFSLAGQGLQGLQSATGDTFYFALIADSHRDIVANWPAELPRGVIHADLFPDNVFFIGNKVSGIIDFYFACTDFLAYDVAVTMNAWCFSEGEFNPAKATALIANYQQSRALTKAEKDAFPILLRGAALRFLLTRAHDMIFHEEGALVRPHDPLEYALKLRFHQQAHGAKTYGIDA